MNRPHMAEQRYAQNGMKTLKINNKILKNAKRRTNKHTSHYV